MEETSVFLYGLFADMRTFVIFVIEKIRVGFAVKDFFAFAVSLINIEVVTDDREVGILSVAEGAFLIGKAVHSARIQRSHA